MTTAFLYNNRAEPRAEAIIRKTSDGWWIEYINRGRRELAEQFFWMHQDARQFAERHNITIIRDEAIW